MLVFIVTLQWIIYMAALPAFIIDAFYFPGWIIGLIGFLFYSYWLVEVGLLKAFYRFRNPRIAQQRLSVKTMKRGPAATSENSEDGGSLNERQVLELATQRKPQDGILNSEAAEPPLRRKEGQERGAPAPKEAETGMQDTNVSLVDLNDIEKTILKSMQAEQTQQDTTPSCVKTFQRQITFFRITRCFPFYIFVFFTVFLPL